MDLDTLIAEREIAHAIYRFARAMDERDWGALGGVLLEEANADLGMGVVSGRAAIVTFIRSFLDDCGPTQHLIGNLIVEVDGARDQPLLRERHAQGHRRQGASDIFHARRVPRHLDAAGREMVDGTASQVQSRAPGLDRGAGPRAALSASRPAACQSASECHDRPQSTESTAAGPVPGALQEGPGRPGGRRRAEPRQLTGFMPRSVIARRRWSAPLAWLPALHSFAPLSRCSVAACAFASLL